MPDLKFACIMPRRFAWCCFFTVAVLSACSTESVKNTTQLEVRTQQPQRQPAKAREKTYGLKDANAEQRLLQADTLVQSGDNEAAQKELDLIRQAELSFQQRSKFSLLAAQIALSMADAEKAMQNLKQVRPALLSSQDKINYYQSLAFANLLLGDVLKGVGARLRLGNLLQDPKQQQANIAAIVDMLSVLPDSVLETHPEVADELKGWMSLARILKQQRLSGQDIEAQIQQWRQEFPGHAANAEFLQAYLALPPNQTGAAYDSEQATQAAEGGMIAVLLPTSGAYAPAGKAVKVGLEAAHRLAASTSPQLPIKFYDSAQDDIGNLYQQAVADGAKQVVGPLVKEQIQALAANAHLAVPVLALNHVENVRQNNLYQFGLSPIDEAEALALKAQHDGRRSAFVLVPNTAQGERIGNYLTDAWHRLGGTVAGIQSYDPRQHDIAAALTKLISSSTYPSGQVPSRAVFLSANAEAARELAPQLKYHQTTDLAVYAMPSIYSGAPHPVEDAELGLFSFCDIPWLFNSYFSGPLSQSALASSWQGMPDSLSRLVALGVDAYNLLSHLEQLPSVPFAGATGQLTVDSENRVVRKLVCAQFKGGVPVATGYAD